jgi:light-regulated signal transduction histidine kinase (bacteriophytochrome)
MFTGIVRDISEYKRSQASLKQYATDLAQSNSELEKFAYVASHDLQEPLRMVASYLQLLERRYADNLDDDGREFIEYAVDGALRMKRLINDLLMYSRVGTRCGQFVDVDCDHVFENVVTDLEVVIEETEALVTSDPLPHIWADETQFHQLLQNLIANAIKFHGEATPKVHISAEPDGEMWKFTVADNGIGIDPKFAARVFVIFQRLHGLDQFPGTGIGLAVCKKIVERHGGTISIDSMPGEGAKFRFTLPNTKEQPDDDYIEEQPAHRDLVSGGQPG